MATAPSFVIPRCSGTCAGLDRALEPAERIVVVLLEPTEAIDGDGFERLDFTQEAWEAGSRPDPSRTVFAVWHAEAPVPGKKADALISAQGLLDLFEQLEGTEEPRRRAFRYVLALQLMRKRQLEYAGTGPGGLLVRPRGSDTESEPLVVHDPQSAGELDEQALEDLAEQVEALMEPTDAP